MSTSPTRAAESAPTIAPTGQPPDRSAWFATAAVAAAAVALAGAVVVGITADGDGDGTTVGAATGPSNQGDDGAVADPNADPAAVVAASATAMGDVTSVEFALARTGAAVYIDEFESIELDSLRGQFTVPGQAQAELTVTVNDNLATKLGAVALDDEIWISNPVTGDFEPLPIGYDIDPSRFFDPEGGWEPLLASLTDIELVGIDDRGGERYHVRGTAPAEQVREITVNLVRDQDVVVDFWIHPDTSLVTAAEFTTTIDDAEADWMLELSRYGDEFTIRPPENVRAASTDEA